MNMRTLLPSLLERDAKDVQPFESLRKEVDKLFDDFARGLRMPDVFTTLGRFDVIPDMDVHETDKEIALSVELPGVEQKDIDISVTGKTVSISGEKKSESQTTEKKNGEVLSNERSYGSFSRSLTLPFEIDGDKVDAKFDKGVLKVTVQKPAEAQQPTKKVAITT